MIQKIERVYYYIHTTVSVCVFMSFIVFREENNNKRKEEKAGIDDERQKKNSIMYMYIN